MSVAAEITGHQKVGEVGQLDRNGLLESGVFQNLCFFLLKFMFNIILYWFHEYNVVVRHYVIYALIPPISPVPTHPALYTAFATLQTILESGALETEFKEG